MSWRQDVGKGKGQEADHSLFPLSSLTVMIYVIITKIFGLVPKMDGADDEDSDGSDLDAPKPSHKKARRG